MWREAYVTILPAEITDSLEALAREQWASALDAAPTDAHHLLVAVASTPTAEEVVGFAAVSPSEEENTNSRTVGSLVTLLVEPDRRGQGHGSRLLTAAVETLRTSLFATAITWQNEADTALIEFLVAAGWGPDGARREIDTGVATVTEIRLHTTVG